MSDKLLVFMYAGGSASGKTTTTKTFANGVPDERSQKMEVSTAKGTQIKSVKWTFYENCAVTGNHHSGTDANSGPGAVRSAFFQCAQEYDVVLVDGKINSPQWVEMVNDVRYAYDVTMVELYYQLKPETLLHRLAQRRGVEVESIRLSMYDKCVRYTKVADLFHRNIKKLALVPYETVYIDDNMSPDAIVKLMDGMVYKYLEADYEWG